MFVATDPDSKTRYALVGASPDQARDAVPVDALEARRLSPDLKCGLDGCDVALHFRQPKIARPHWAHNRGAGHVCSTGRTGGEGPWHAWVTGDVFGEALHHEHVVPGARIDVVVQATKKGALVAVEAQHSDIDYETVETRNGAHQAAGMAGSMWILDGSVVLPDVDRAQWGDASITKIVDRVHGGVGAVYLVSGWAAEVLEACADAVDYPCPVGVLLDGVLRFVDHVEVEDVDGRAVAVVTSWSAPFEEDEIRSWAAGRAVSAKMRAARTRRVKLSNRRYDVAWQGDRIRIAFSEHHTDNQRRGVELGLEWVRASDERFLTNPRVTSSVGYLIGRFTPEVEAWMPEAGIYLPAA